MLADYLKKFFTSFFSSFFPLVNRDLFILIEEKALFSAFIEFLKKNPSYPREEPLDQKFYSEETIFGSNPEGGLEMTYKILEDKLRNYNIPKEEIVNMIPSIKKYQFQELIKFKINEAQTQVLPERFKRNYLIVLGQLEETQKLGDDINKSYQLVLELLEITKEVKKENEDWAVGKLLILQEKYFKYFGGKNLDELPPYLQEAILSC